MPCGLPAIARPTLVITQVCPIGKQALDRAPFWAGTRPYRGSLRAADPTIRQAAPSDTRMGNAFVIYVVGVLALSIPAPAEQAARPDFSGVWMITNVPAQAGTSGGVAALPPAPKTVRQTPASIAIDRTAFGQVITMTFTIGAEKDDTNRTGAQVWTTRTRWEGKSLVTRGSIIQSTTAGVDEWDYTETRTMDGRGHMIVETRHVDQNGKVTAGKQDYERHKPSRPAPGARP